MRRKRSTAVQSTLLASAVVHGSLLLLVWFARSSHPTSPADAFEVYTVSEKELEALEPRMPEFEQAASPDGEAASLSPEQIKALPRDRERLPEHKPSPEAVTDFRGQIVELADPARAQDAPPDAEYLSRANHRVDHETASQEFRINPDVVAPTMSAESSLAHAHAGTTRVRLEGDPGRERGVSGVRDGERLASLPPRAAPPAEALPPPSKREATAPPPTVAPTEKPTPKEELTSDASELLAHKPTLAQVLTTSPMLSRLNPRLRPPDAQLAPSSATTREQDGDPNGSERQLAALPQRSRYGQGEGGGDNGSAPVQLQQGELKGAPSNDRLHERKSTATMLNAREFKYFGYMQLIRRQVTFYWSQALDNVGTLSSKPRLSEYTTILHVAIDRKGNLKSASLVRSCGIKTFDDATLQAFRIAAPFPPPPEGMINGAGDAEMPEFGFTVTLGQPPPRFSGIDPRANVRFPGIYRPD